MVGQPTDTVKTKMQAQAGHFESKNSLFQIVKDVYKEGGIRGFYRGALPAFTGSVMFRST